MSIKDYTFLFSISSQEVITLSVDNLNNTIECRPLGKFKKTYGSEAKVFVNASLVRNDSEGPSPVSTNKTLMNKLKTLNDNYNKSSRSKSTLEQTSTPSDQGSTCNTGSTSSDNLSSLQDQSEPSFSVTAGGSATSRADSIESSKKLALTSATEAAQSLAQQLLTDKFNQFMNNKTSEMNTILIVFDELTSYHRLPKRLTDQLPGYQKFKKRGVEFTNIHNHRSYCSASRSTIFTSQINTGIQDNIDQIYQYEFVPQLSPDFDTIPKMLKRNSIQSTAYIGKSHLTSQFAVTDFCTPNFDCNTRPSYNIYGYDTYSTFGDCYYYHNEGYFCDQTTHQFQIMDNNLQVDFTSESGGKYIGVIPYIVNNLINNISFHLYACYMNPHDTMHYWQNVSQIPNCSQLQFPTPFLEEQCQDMGVANPYELNGKNLLIENSNFSKNYFEPNYNDYKSDYSSLFYLESYTLDYAETPVVNSPFIPFVGMAVLFDKAFSFPTSSSDIKSWKNLMNNYCGLVTEIDIYLNDIYDLIDNFQAWENTSVIIVADHGDQMGAHGLKQKGYIFNESQNIPCIITAPGLQGDQVNTKLGGLIDIAPTIEVIINAESRSPEFKGTPLVYRQPDGSLAPRNEDITQFHVFNAIMCSTSYYYLVPYLVEKSLTPSGKTWLESASNSIPRNYFNYQFCFTQIQKTINGVQYKLGRYFNLNEIYAYNFIFNTNVTDQLSKNDSGIALIPSINSAVLNEMFVETDIYTTAQVDILLYYVDQYVATYNTSDYTYKEMLKFIELNTTDEFGFSNSVALFLYMHYINNVLREYVPSGQIMIPGQSPTQDGTVVTFSQLYNDPDRNYYYFLYDETNDNNEIFNLLDKKYPDRQTPKVLEIANTLNDDLNQLTKATLDGEASFIFFISNIIFTAAVQQIGEFGQDDMPYWDERNLDQLVTLFGANNLDSTLKTTFTGKVKPGFTSIKQLQSK